MTTEKKNLYLIKDEPTGDPLFVLAESMMAAIRRWNDAIGLPDHDPDDDIEPQQISLIACCDELLL